MSKEFYPLVRAAAVVSIITSGSAQMSVEEVDDAISDAAKKFNVELNNDVPRLRRDLLAIIKTIHRGVKRCH